MRGNSCYTGRRRGVKGRLGTCDGTTCRLGDTCRLGKAIEFSKRGTLCYERSCGSTAGELGGAFDASIRDNFCYNRRLGIGWRFDRSVTAC